MRRENHRARVDQRCGAQADEAVLFVDDHLADAVDARRIARCRRRAGIGDDDLRLRRHHCRVAVLSLELRREIAGILRLCGAGGA